MFAAIIKRLDVAIELILKRLQAVKRWVAAFDISTQDVLFLQEKLINLRAIHSEYHTKIDELFAVIPDDKIDERTAKVIEFDDIYDSIVVRVKRYIANVARLGHRSEFNCLRYRCLDLMVTLVNGFTSATNLRR
jgi:basic membrane lipoprotein Med (substrate-binding protein (PBP1-ABC) superfamily)